MAVVTRDSEDEALAIYKIWKSGASIKRVLHLNFNKIQAQLAVVMIIELSYSR